MIHYGDITKISGYDVPVVDCVVGGSPCQDLSVAGKRAGLDGERSGLFMEQIRITKEMRDKDEQVNGRSGVNVRPRFFIWENVPGAFSSNKGEDFRVVLEEIAKIVDKDAVIPMPDINKNKWTTSGAIVGDGWSIAWRILDAQFWGVPQRRRRITLVADFGGGCAQEVLFERKSLRGDTKESRTKGQGTTTDAQGCIGVHDRDGKGTGYGQTDVIRCIKNSTGRNTIFITEDVSPTLVADSHNHACFVPYTLEPGIASREGGHIYEDISGTLRANAGDNQMSVAYGFDQGATRDVGVLFLEEQSKTLANGSCPGHHNGVVICYDIGDRRSVANESVDVSPTLLSKMGTGGNNVPVVVEGLDAYNQSLTGDKAKTLIKGGGKSGAYVTEGVTPTLTCTHGGEPVICLQGNGIDRADTAGCNGKGWKEDTCYTLNTVDRPAVVYKKPHYIVRRLTPLECERLQGYPDGWTDIGEYIDSKGKKKQSSDSARYKALGNSIALPTWKWVIKRLCSHYERDATLCSLFDGIGGFPLIWEQINGKGSCLWASEIEDFPIAVTKKRIE